MNLAMPAMSFFWSGDIVSNASVCDTPASAASMPWTRYRDRSVCTTPGCTATAVPFAGSRRRNSSTTKTLKTLDRP